MYVIDFTVTFYSGMDDEQCVHDASYIMVEIVYDECPLLFLYFIVLYVYSLLFSLPRLLTTLHTHTKQTSKTMCVLDDADSKN